MKLKRLKRWLFHHAPRLLPLKDRRYFEVVEMVANAMGDRFDDWFITGKHPWEGEIPTPPAPVVTLAGNTKWTWSKEEWK